MSVGDRTMKHSAFLTTLTLLLLGRLAAIPAVANGVPASGINIVRIAKKSDMINPGGRACMGLPPFEWQVEDQALNATGPLSVLFTTGAFDNLAGLQCAFQFDPARLRFDSLKILPAIPLTFDDFGLGEVQSGVIRLAWSSVQSVDLEPGDEAFRLYFTVLQTGGLLSEVLALNDTLLPGIAVNSDLEETTVTLEFSHSTGTDDPDRAPRSQFLAAQPNPFVETTTLRFMMPRAGEAALRITDGAGRLLFSQTKHYPAGTQQETLWLEGARGVLFAELVTEQGSVVQKMLAVKN